MQKPINYYDSHKGRFVNALKELVRIPGVSFKDFPEAPLQQSARQVKRLLTEAGLKKVEMITVPGVPPYVFGEHMAHPNAPTVLLYAHYDVQPPMRKELWKSPAFEPVERAGRLYGRGTADDKAGVVVHAASIAACLNSGAGLPVNVKVIIEGEEEMGSPHLYLFLKRHLKKLKTDCLIVLDGTNFDTGIPTLTTSLRGLATFTITVSSLKNPLHSGLWGGPIPDSVTALCKMIASLTGPDGRPALKGLWKGVLPPSRQEVADMRALRMTPSRFKQQAGFLSGVEIFGKGDGVLRRLWHQHSFVVNSMVSGDKKLAGNVVMDSAWARVGLRLAPGVLPPTAKKIVHSFLKKTCPWGLKLSVSMGEGSNPWKADIRHPAFGAARRALSKGYGRPAVYAGCGASIPFVDEFTKALGPIPVLIAGIEDPYTRAHSENESLCLSDFHKAVKGQILFFQEFSKIKV